MKLSSAITKWKETKNTNNAGLLLKAAIEAVPVNAQKEFYRNFLNETAHPDFLNKLENDELRNKWADLALYIIRIIDYDLKDLFEDRASEHPDKPLFVMHSGSKVISWNYERIKYYTKELAAGFYKKATVEPKVAIYSDNSIISASADLACLFYDILVSPVNINFGEDELSDIFSRLDINLVVTDTEERYRRLVHLRENSGLDFDIFITAEDVEPENERDVFLGSYISSLSHEEITQIIDSRKKMKLNEVATVMFTSGSTGRPKGISFSIYNLVAKRFCRNAAVPFVGKDEIFLCYLPLFHTFGRFLEMLGAIYWRGTYVFTGNTSTETLLRLFAETKPSVFISVPIRWLQLEEKAEKSMKESDAPEEKLVKFRESAGSSLKWGLSAAGYLSPKTFKFFRYYGVELCSGFGMTEATGGVTMTPPGDYVEESVGRALPGIYLKLAEHNELHISGHYVARYLDDKGPGDIIPYPEDEEYWLPTGDVFEIIGDGHYKIVDRLKDIYKNNRGQTIAPRNVENKFTNVPGIKRTFLVGDGKPSNVLLLVPDESEEVLTKESEQTRKDYYHQIVRAANSELPSYERVVNYMILNRDFDSEKGELTPKGSFKRKNIIDNFKNDIDQLYKSEYTILDLKDCKCRIKIPRWFFRDIGVLEDDIVVDEGAILNTVSKKKLTLRKVEREEMPEHNSFIIGDLEYKVKGDTIDLGRISRQPLLWFSNPELIEFIPYKTGWDTRFGSFYDHVFLFYDNEKIYEKDEIPDLKKVRTQQLDELNKVLSLAVLGSDDDSLEALDKISEFIGSANENEIKLMRSRLETLARHRNLDIRAKAYRILLLDEPDPDYTHKFPAFLASGLPFMTDRSIQEIATGKLERRRLEALRKRLHSYRRQLEFPASENTKKQFENMFELLIRFIRVHPEYYNSVRFELTNWLMLRDDPELASIAEHYFNMLSSYYEYRLDSSVKGQNEDMWSKKLVFDQILNVTEIENIKDVLTGTAFLKQSVLISYDEKEFEVTDIEDEGIWISRLETSPNCRHYRLCVNTKDSRNYEFQVFINDRLGSKKELEGVYWHLIISGYPFGVRVLPRLGAVRPELNARSLEYINEISVWSKIRQYASQRISGEEFSKSRELRRLFTEAITAFFKAWDYSGRKIVPGYITPENVYVPELDFSEGATVNSINGWSKYEKPSDMFIPVIQNFYVKTTHHYSWIFDQINLKWIFDAILEAIGFDDAFNFFDDLKLDLGSKNYKYRDKILINLDEYLESLDKGYYEPLSLLKAIRRYKQWESDNPDASPKAMEETLLEISRLYRLNRYPELIRYIYYKNTYFSKADSEIHEAFNNLITKMTDKHNVSATQLIELSELQSKLDSDVDRHVFSRMVYPKLLADEDVDILTTGDSRNRHVILQSHFRDKLGIVYNFREPKNPAEIGQLYRLFFKEKYPKSISDLDEYFVVTDSIDRVIGGICYKQTGEDEVLLDGNVVISSMKGRGIDSYMLKDFAGRMANKGIQVIKTHFFMKNFYLSQGFNVDKDRGALVKHLTPEISEMYKGEYCKIY